MQPAMREIRPLTSLRGIFACWVMILHISNSGLADPNQSWIVGEGYLAVDFFFFLSGYILAGTYGDRMAAGISGRQGLERSEQASAASSLFGLAEGEA